MEGAHHSGGNSLEIKGERRGPVCSGLGQSRENVWLNRGPRNVHYERPRILKFPSYRMMIDVYLPTLNKTFCPGLPHVAGILRWPPATGVELHACNK